MILEIKEMRVDGIRKGYGCVFNFNGTNYFASITDDEEDGIECIIYLIDIKYSNSISEPDTVWLKKIVYTNDDDGNFVSPTSLARHIETYTKCDDMDWVFVNKEGTE